MVKVTLPLEAGNALVWDPNMAARMDTIMADIKPEAAYFAIDGGQRTIYFVVTVENAEDIPGIAEPLWLSWNVYVSIVPVFVGEDMEKVRPRIAELLKKY